jgi:hypothetical protein
LFRRTLLGWYVRFTTTASGSYDALRKKRGNEARSDRTVNRCAGLQSMRTRIARVETVAPRRRLRIRGAPEEKLPVATFADRPRMIPRRSSHFTDLA